MAKLSAGVIKGNILIRQHGEYRILGISKHFVAILIEHYGRIDIERKTWDTNKHNSSSVATIYVRDSRKNWLVQTQATVAELEEVISLIMKLK